MVKLIFFSRRITPVPIGLGFGFGTVLGFGSWDKGLTILIFPLLASGYWVTATIHIENYSKWNLVEGHSWSKSGRIKSSALKVKAGEKEIWETHKVSGTTTGVSGIIAYELGDTGITIAIVWEAPYDFNWYENILAIGFLGKLKPDKLDDWFDDLYYNKNINTPRCYKTYYYGTEPCKVSSEYVSISATMGTNHHPNIDITIMPVDKKDLFDYEEVEEEVEEEYVYVDYKTPEEEKKDLESWNNNGIPDTDSEILKFLDKNREAVVLIIIIFIILVFVLTLLVIVFCFVTKAMSINSRNHRASSPTQPATNKAIPMTLLNNDPLGKN